jgi:hypothetical protein
MHFRISGSILFLLLRITLTLLPGCTIAQPSEPPKKPQLSVGPVWERTDFRWSIDGTLNGQYINVLSELIFKPVHAAGFFVRGSYPLSKKLSASASYTQQFTFQGKVSDRDYNGANRSQMVTDLNLQSNSGNSKSVSAQLDYDFYNENGFSLRPGAGFNLANELFKLSDDSNPDLKSSYSPKWYGPYALMDLYKVISPKVVTGVGAHVYYLNYRAKANWNLIETVQHPVSFTHQARGYGLDLDGKVIYRLNRNTTAGVRAVYSNWRSNVGTDKLYLSDGQIQTTNMNGAFRKTFGTELSANFSF